MTKHSKNNTASSIFSYHEFKRLDYGTKRQRLGNESMRPYDACVLCLQKARAPVACSSGHLFCKECVYADLLEQKNAIKKQKQLLERLKKEAEVERAQAQSEARKRVLLEFERAQIGLGLGGVKLTSTSGSTKKETGGVEKAEERDGNADEPRGTKRKASELSFSVSEVEKLAEEAEAEAAMRIEREAVESMKAKLPDFWLPSLTPTHDAAKTTALSLKDIKAVPTCKGGKDAHELSMKKLMPVEFAYPKDLPPDVRNPADRRDAICPSCKKGFSNNTVMFLMTSCSHVLCRTCTDTLVRPGNQCVVCDAPAPKEKVLELKREGTGYAGGGMAEASKVGVAFQG